MMVFMVVLMVNSLMMTLLFSVIVFVFSLMTFVFLVMMLVFLVMTKFRFLMPSFIFPTSVLCPYSMLFKLTALKYDKNYRFILKYRQIIV